MVDHTILAGVSGAIGFALLIVWPLLHGRRLLLAGQAASAVAYAIHYALIGATTGAAMLLLSIMQVAAAWSDSRSPAQRVVFAATIPALAAFAWATWGGVVSVFAAAGLTFSTLGRWQRSPAALRILFLASGAAWLVHDVMAGSTPAILGDVLACGTLMYGMWRDRAA